MTAAFDQFLALVTADVTHAPCAWGRKVNPVDAKADPCDLAATVLLSVPATDGSDQTAHLPLCSVHGEHVRAAYEDGTS